MKPYKHLTQLLLSAAVATLLASCAESSTPTTVAKTVTLPETITITGVAQNPEGIEYDKNDHTFLLSSLNAVPIIKVKPDGTFTPFASGEKFPLSTAGLQIDYPHNRLLVAGFNGTEIMDDDPKTKGTSFLLVYNLETGVLEQEVNLAALAPDANAYFANDIAVDREGNAYVSDWFAGLIYKVDLEGKASIFWKNDTGIPGGPNGLDYHQDGYLLVSVISDPSYAKHGLIKIPLNDPLSAKQVAIVSPDFAGFDGMVIKPDGKVVGVTNNQKVPGGNVFVELSSNDGWASAEVIHTKPITTSTTVAVTPDGKNYLINQDFSDNFAKTWHIEQISF